jgi:hypothetical protein
MSTILDAKVNYATGGAIWIFDTPFTTPPTVCIGLQMGNLGVEVLDDIYPLSAKIVSLTETSVTVKVYKVVLTDRSDLLFSECADNDVIVHITAEGT